MNYVFLNRGCVLPAVGVLQLLLNRQGAHLEVDGIFGQRTESAVRQFQRSHRLEVDGVVGEQTWPRLVGDEDLQIADCVDITDPSLLRLEATDLLLTGGSPFLIGGMCNGVEQAVQQITAGIRGKVFLLRFHGHGNVGAAGVGFGEGTLDSNGTKINMYGEKSDIDTYNLDEVRPYLARLRGIFGPYGNIQFMHCKTGRGTTGLALLKNIAQIVGVPVTAAVNTQYGSGIKTFKFEGPTQTACPPGMNLKTWCTSRRQFACMSLA
ncbi:MAG: peptidoglycan-binding protein [Acidobacteriia bacterium]|nr:peptidoglycan-binding protein [Terriglobia bacterium]